MIGVLMSATLPARLGEPSRALIVAAPAGPGPRPLPGRARNDGLADAPEHPRAGRPRRGHVRDGRALPRRRGGARARHGRAGRAARARARAAVAASPRPPSRFRRGRRAATAVRERDGAGALRAARCSASPGWAHGPRPAARGLGRPVARLLPAPGGARPRRARRHRRRGGGPVRGQRDRGAAATPSNLGVFQAACVAVLSAYGVGKTDALAYGIVLQAVEIATALAMGMPALVREGMSWRDMRLRALHRRRSSSRLSARRSSSRHSEAAESEA